MVKKFTKYEVELVVYDEAEYFYDFDHKSFNYPYIDRKSFLSFWKFDPLLINENNIYKNYDYPRSTIEF